MNEQPISADDPRLTAYVLGELDPAERAVVEAALQRDPALRVAVEGIRQTTVQLEAALLAEPDLPGVGPEAPAAMRPADAYRRGTSPGAGRLLQFPQVYYVVGGLAAACFAVMVIFRSPVPPPAVAAKAPAASAEPETIRIPIAFAPTEKSTGESALAMSVAPAAVADAAAGSGVSAKSAQARGQAEAPAGRRKAAPVAAAAAARSVAPAVSAPTAASFRAASGGRVGVARGAEAAGVAEHDFVGVAESPRSSLPARVGTESYSAVRAALTRGELPAADVVRTEELVNHFPYAYAAPETGSADAFSAALEVAEAPWASGRRLVRVALQGRPTGPGSEAAESARDLAIEVTFNARKVSSYRLIGFDPVKTAAQPDVGPQTTASSAVLARHQITAFYEIVPAGAEAEALNSTPSRAADLSGPRQAAVQTRLEAAPTNDGPSEELLRVKLSYQLPGVDGVRVQEFPLADAGRRFDEASADFKFAAAVAEFGLILRGSAFRGGGTLGDVVAWATAGSRGTGGPADQASSRAEFLDLARRAQALLR